LSEKRNSSISPTSSGLILSERIIIDSLLVFKC
jgi:hypothetical protein